MSDPGPFGGSENGPDFGPFGAFGMFGDLARMLAGQGPLHWDAARQMAMMLATENRTTGDLNVDPLVRIRWEEFGRIAELHVQDVTGLDTGVAGRAAAVVPVTPVIWTDRTLAAYRPLFERLAGALHRPGPGGTSGIARPDDASASDDPGAAMIAGILQMLAPSLLGMSAGSMIGHLARRNLGSYDLPLPRPADREVLVIDENVSRFADDWSLPLDEVRLWVCLTEITHHALFGVAHLRAALEDLLGRYVAGFHPQPDAIADRFAELDAPSATPDDLQRLLGSPELFLGAIASPEQQSLEPALDALVAVILGYVDHTVDRASKGLIASAGQIAEAARRRRVEAAREDQFVERLFGLSLTRQQVERGHAFVDGVLERAGDDGLGRLWHDRAALPTPAEVDAPGLWLARLDL